MCYVLPHIVDTNQVLDVSYCVLQPGHTALLETAIIVQITLGVSMCLLVAIQFIKELLQMYKATKRFQMNRYMNLLAREGMTYFAAYVCVPIRSHISLPMLLNERWFVMNSTLTYAFVVLLTDVARIPTDGWRAIVLGPISSVAMVTLVPRFILTLRRLYERDLQGRHCGSNNDMALGLSSASGRHAPVSTIVFANVEQNEGLEEYDERRMEGVEVGGNLGG